MKVLAGFFADKGTRNCAVIDTLVRIRRKAQEAGVLIFPAEAANPRSTTSFQNGDQDGLAVNSSPSQLEAKSNSVWSSIASTNPSPMTLVDMRKA